MAKKKAIKLAAATAVAASAFVAAAPAQTDAASSVAVEVSKAVTQMKKAYHTYSDVTATGSFQDITEVYKQYNAAKTAYNNAKALVNKSGGASKDALLAELETTYADFIAKRVVTYIDAYNYATTLQAKELDLKAALEDNEWDLAEELYHAISYELKTRTVILDRVYGESTRELLRGSFKADAQAARDSITNEVTVKMAYDAAEGFLAEGDLESAQAQFDKVADYVAELNEDTDFGAALLAKVTEVQAAYDELAVPQVQSVSVNNLKTVVINFNKAVDSKTVTSSTVKVYEGSNTTATTVDTDSTFSEGVRYILSEDKKTLTVEFFTQNSQSENIKVLVDGVKAVDGTAVAKFEETKSVLDNVVPELSSAVSLNKKQIELQFSEPVNLTKTAFEVLNNIKLDGVAAIAKVTPNHAENTLVLEFASNLKTGTLKLDVADISDFAGFKIAAKSFDVTVAEDTTAPELTGVEVVNKNKVRVTFNEKVATLGSFEVNDETIEGDDIAEVTGSNGTKFDLTLDTALNLGAVVEAKVEYKGQKDVADNEVKDWKTYTFKVADDTSLPTVTSSLADGNKLTLTFSKSMRTDLGTIKVLDKDGKEVRSLNVSGLGFKANTDNKVLELTGAQLGLSNVDAAQYTVKIKDMKDNSIRENLLPEQTLTIDAKDTKKPLVSGGYLVSAGALTSGDDHEDDDTFTLFFNEKMDEGTLRNLSNYNVSGVGTLATVSGVSIKSIAADGKSVVITYPNAASLTANITVSALKDAAGNMIDTVVVGKETGTELDVVATEATKKNEVLVQFNTAIKSVDPSAIKIQRSTDSGVTWTDYALPVSATVQSDNTKVKFVLNKDMGTAASEYRIVDNNSQLVKNIYNDTFKVVSGTADATDTIAASITAGSVAFTDKIAPEMVSVKRHASETDKIVVTFSEALNDTTATALEYDLRVKDLTSDTDLAINEFTTAISGTTVTIDITKANVAGHKFSVALLNGRSLVDAANSNEAVTFTATTVKNDAGTEDALISENVAPSAADNTKLTLNNGGITGAAGAVEGGATVKVFADGAVVTTATPVATFTAAANGSFAKQVLAANDYDVYVVDAAGNISAKLDVTVTVTP
ncbi:hypothetical protein ACFYKX_14385 [Cytobacillus sp. FJAT-54145]|uniref:SbsC C-terminal domain-containing protein n=1 Tax=Cytobacillus spartinae TaxID=3299023 RepID=A0ABW6KDG6_9BACI